MNLSCERFFLTKSQDRMVERLMSKFFKQEEKIIVGKDKIHDGDMVNMFLTPSKMVSIPVQSVRDDGSLVLYDTVHTRLLGLGSVLAPGSELDSIYCPHE